jgi:hypothetical protein
LPDLQITAAREIHRQALRERLKNLPARKNFFGFRTLNINPDDNSTSDRRLVGIKPVLPEKCSRVCPVFRANCHWTT